MGYLCDYHIGKWLSLHDASPAPSLPLALSHTLTLLGLQAAFLSPTMYLPLIPPWPSPPPPPPPPPPPLYPRLLCAHFVTLPAELSEDIKAFTRHLTRGFRSVKIEARIGETTWKTSLFPSKEQGAYLLPIKKSVRAAEKISEGSSTEIHLRVPT